MPRINRRGPAADAREAPLAPSGLREDVLSAARAHDRRPRLAVHAPLVAAVILASVAIGGLVANRLVARPVSATAPRLGFPEKDFGPVPLHGAVQWAIDAREPGWLIAFGTTGRPVGTLRLGGTLSSGQVSANADGSVVWTGDRFVDRRGRTAGTLGSTKGLFVWSDLPDEVCGITHTPANWTLWTYRMGGVLRTVRYDSDRATELAGCSATGGVALLVDHSPTGGDAPSSWARLKLIRLSDGAVVATRVEDAFELVTSPDLTYYAVNHRLPDGGFSGQIRRTADGGVVAGIDAAVVAFSGDSRLYATAGAAGPGAVFSLATGAEVTQPVSEMRGAIDATQSPFGAEAFVLSQLDAPGFIVVALAGGFQADYGRLEVVPARRPGLSG